MPTKLLGLVISLALVAGCTCNGRYQFGDAFGDPSFENVQVVPVLDTQTGQLWLLSGHNATKPEAWELKPVGRVSDAE